MVALCYRLFLVFACALAESPIGSCGVHAAPECTNDMGSCGNACCMAEFTSTMAPSVAFASIVEYLRSGGSDGLFKYTGGAGNLAVSDGSEGGKWASIFQGNHTTFKARYVDTLNFAVRTAPSGRSIVRVFSISDVQGALGDMGQNRRTLSLLGKDLNLGTMKLIFGCGTAPSSLPASAATHLNLIGQSAQVESLVADAKPQYLVAFAPYAMSALLGAVCMFALERVRERFNEDSRARQGTASYLMM